MPRPRPIPAAASRYWGVALSRWGNPFAAGIKPPATIQAGNAAVASAKKAGARTEREQAFIGAVANLYTDADKQAQRARVLAYRDAMKLVASRYPADPEATAFYALALASSQDPTDMTYASLLEAGQILEKLVPTQPNHPASSTTSFTPTTRRRSPRARSTRRAATPRSRRRRRTRCTCPRTRSRAWATGRIRSRPTSRRQTRRGG